MSIGLVSPTPLKNAFKTSIDIEEKDNKNKRNTINVLNILNDIKFNNSSPNSLIKLPPSVNLITLREILLSDAPFVTRMNRKFWKKWIDLKPFGQVLASSYHIINQSISDNGTIYIQNLYNLTFDQSISSAVHTTVAYSNELLYKNLAYQFTNLFMYNSNNITLNNPNDNDNNLSQQSYMKLSDRDRFFQKFPEILCYMIINALLASIPKHYRIYNSLKFREILLDWCLEIVSGIQVSYPKVNREWLFHDALDSSIFIVQSNNITTTTSSSISKSIDSNDGELAARPLSSYTSKDYRLYRDIKNTYCIEHSPLVTIYLNNINNNNYKSINEFKNADNDINLTTTQYIKYLRNNQRNKLVPINLTNSITNNTITNSTIATNSITNSNELFEKAISLSNDTSISSPNYKKNVTFNSLSISSPSSNSPTNQSPNYKFNSPLFSPMSSSPLTPINRSSNNINSNTVDNQQISNSYINNNVNTVKTKNPLTVKLKLTHFYDRPLITMSTLLSSQPSSTSNVSSTLRLDYNEMKKSIKQCSKIYKKLSNDINKNNITSKKDLIDIKMNYNKYIKSYNNTINKKLSDDVVNQIVESTIEKVNSNNNSLKK